MYICPENWKTKSFITGERVDIFLKFFLQYADMHKESSQVHGQYSLGLTRGVAGPRPFFVIQLLQDNGWIFLHDSLCIE